MQLSFATKLGYGVGHVLNDLCASIWFTYALVYYNLVIKLRNIDAGLLLLIGQIADGLATPLVGYLSDRCVISKFLYDRYGKRKTWHFIGTIGILVSMPFMFTPCLYCGSGSEVFKLVYYSLLIVLFQICWAIVQISHLSLAPDLTLDPNERTQLLSLRTTFAVLSNIAVYSVAWGVLAVDTTGSSNDITSDDTKQFQIIVYTIVAVGALMSLIFHLCVKENNNRHQLLDQTLDERRTIKSLFKTITLYQVAIVYMCARLFGNMIQVLIPFYVHVVMTIGAQSIAVVPFVMYISSFITSLFTGPMNQRFGRKVAFLYGSLVGAGGVVAIAVGYGPIYATYIIYLTAVFLGSCQSTFLVTSLATIADFIGNDIGNGAFVYGIMSLTDKLSSGAAIMLVQAFKPETVGLYYHYALTITCGSSVVLGAIIMFTIRTRRMNPGNNAEHQTTQNT